jgi:hypothetical protein
VASGETLSSHVRALSRRYLLLLQKDAFVQRVLEQGARIAESYFWQATHDVPGAICTDRNHGIKARVVGKNPEIVRRE